MIDGRQGFADGYDKLTLLMKAEGVELLQDQGQVIESYEGRYESFAMNRAD
jgi:hypothetical protein